MSSPSDNDWPAPFVGGASAPAATVRSSGALPEEDAPPPVSPAPLDRVRALTFDVFGTVVDWRSSVVRELVDAARDRQATLCLALGTAHNSDTLFQYKARLESLTPEDWATFAQEWRNSYGVFTQSFVPGVDPWKDIDAHHHDSLVELLIAWGLGHSQEQAQHDMPTAAQNRTTTIYSSSQLNHLSRVWHRLSPWPDSAAGLHALGEAGYVTATLSNGTRELLQDLDRYGKLGFKKIISTADFGAYKPHPSTYLGAVNKLVGSRSGSGAKPELGTSIGEGQLGGDPAQVAMVAAHLGDLAAARSLGLRTIYVERLREEAWGVDEERYKDARNWVDLWIGQDEGGFLEVARRLST